MAVVEERGSSARQLLLTLLGEFVLPSGGAVWTSTLVEALCHLEVAPKTARQAIARASDAGWLEGERVGRLTRWRLSEDAAGLLTEGTERIYGFGRQLRQWDGKWLLLLTTVPETSRHLRYRLRTRLAWEGFAPIGPGNWISPWVDQVAEAAAALQRLGVEVRGRTFIGELGDGDPRALAEEAWALPDLEAAYEAFIDRFSAVDPASDLDAFVALTGLVDEWRRFPALDPGLPDELLPVPWGGHEAMELFHRRHEQWSPAAQRYYKHLEDRR